MTFTIYIYSNYCMQDTFARATHSAYAAARPSARATIGYLVYNSNYSLTIIHNKDFIYNTKRKLILIFAIVSRRKRQQISLIKKQKLINSKFTAVDRERRAEDISIINRVRTLKTSPNFSPLCLRVSTFG